MSERIAVALIGTGFMGKTHALAYNNLSYIYNPKLKPYLKTVADISEEQAKEFVTRYNFENYTTTWKDILDDDDIKIISITAPNFLHKEMAEECIKRGKHVWCEKPLTLSFKESEALTHLATENKVKTCSGYSYLQNPMVLFTKDLIDSGEIGELISFSCTENEDYMAHPNSPFDWHCSRAQAGYGALGDLGPHALSLGLFLVGDIKKVSGHLDYVITERPNVSNMDMRAGIDLDSEVLSKAPKIKVETDDQARAILQFENGATGTFETSRIFFGKKSEVSFELVGTKGSILWNQERMNELKFYSKSDLNNKGGFRTILSGTSHNEYSNFCPATGHGLGFNDLKVIEAKNFLQYIESNNKPPTLFDFAFASKVDRILDAIYESYISGTWQSI